MVGDSGDELENIPSRYAARRTFRAFGSWLVSNLSAFVVPVQTLEDKGGANHVATEPNGIGNGLDPNARVCGEAAMFPTEHVVDGVASDELFFYQETKDLGAEKLLEFVGIPIEHVSECAIFQKAAVCNEHMDVRMKIEHFASCGDEPYGPRYDIVAVKVDLKIQPEGSPSTPGQLAQ